MLNKVLSKDFLKSNGENLIELGAYATAGFVVGSAPGALGGVAFCLVRQGSSFVLDKLVEKARDKYEILDSKIAQVALPLLTTSIVFSLAGIAASFCGMQMTWITKVVLPLAATSIAKGTVYLIESIYYRFINPQAKKEVVSVATVPLPQQSSTAESIVDQLRKISRRSA